MKFLIFKINNSQYRWKINITYKNLEKPPISKKDQNLNINKKG